DECEALRQLAHQMAAETDTAALLEIVCDAATKQCDAVGAAVLEVVSNEAELVAGTGPFGHGGGRRFTLRGSLTRDVLRTRDVVSVDDFSATDRPLTQVLPNLRLGPMLLAPLIAHEAIVGVIVVARDAGAPAFTSREGRRLRVIS